MTARANARKKALRKEWGEQLVSLGELTAAMGQAMIDDEEILGVIAGEGIANALAALPRHIREVFLEYASDEAAHGYETDRRYLAAQDAA